MTALHIDAAHPARTGRARRAIAFVAMLTAATAAAGVAWPAIARIQLAAAHPPRGELVDVGGYRLHLDCTGSGPGPTVILEAGNADFSLHWSRLQPLVATTARVCSYDRAGLGWSDPAPQPPTLGRMVRDLTLLLDTAGIEGPLVLVGHSFGAIIARAYAAEHADRVTALVLVDPAHERQLERIPALAQAVEAGVAQFDGLQPLADFGLLALMPGNIPDPGLAAGAHDAYAAVLATTGYFRAAAAETAALAANLEEMAARGGAPTDVPVTIVSRGLPDAPAGMAGAEAADFEVAWADLQADLVALTGARRHVTAAGSRHHVQLTEPEVVASLVAEALGQ